MDAMSTRVVEVLAADLRLLKQQLVQLAPVRSAAQLGQRLRVLVDKELAGRWPGCSRPARRWPGPAWRWSDPVWRMCSSAVPVRSRGHEQSATALGHYPESTQAIGQRQAHVWHGGDDPSGSESMNSLRRLWAITQKELRQLARDRLTFGMVVMIR